MSTFLLPHLYQEFFSLSDKLSQITHLITSYGGEVPAASDTCTVPKDRAIPSPAISINTSPIITPSKTESGAGVYPQKGWEQKIIYALNKMGKYATVKELTQVIKEAEGIDSANDIERIKNVVGQSLSKFAKSGKVAVDSSQREHRYSVIP